MNKRMDVNSSSLKPWHLEGINNELVPNKEEFLGEPLLILFFYLGCPGCKGRAIPFANRLVVEHKDKFKLIGIHSNFEGPEYSDDEISTIMDGLYARFPYYRDAGLATTFHDYEAAGTPHWILVDKDGKIVQSIFGSDPNRALLRLDYSIDELLNMNSKKEN